MRRHEKQILVRAEASRRSEQPNLWQRSRKIGQQSGHTSSKRVLRANSDYGCVASIFNNSRYFTITMIDVKLKVDLAYITSTQQRKVQRTSELNLVFDNWGSWQFQFWISKIHKLPQKVPGFNPDSKCSYLTMASAPLKCWTKTFIRFISAQNLKSRQDQHSGIEKSVLAIPINSTIRLYSVTT